MTIGNEKTKKVFTLFEEISKIPRGSGNTKAISDYCVEFAKKRNLFCTQDKDNNVIIKKKATPGREQDAGVILQGHLDMVTEKKPDSAHDFLKDGLELYVEDGYLKAKDTTLGGDDGIAVAYALAILDSDDISHPALEVIFTTDEETGMEGANKLDMSSIEGKYMLNLDSEQEGIFVAGCAGGVRVRCNIDYRTVVTEGIKCILRVSGLKGGHSGVEIDKERGNADIITARVLRNISDEIYIECIDITGGTKDNVIPRECHADILVKESRIEALREIIKRENEMIQAEYASTDGDVKVELFEEGYGTYAVMLSEDFHNILFYLNAIPNGVINMHPDIKGLVETSLNLGTVYTEDNCLTAISSVRSSVGSRKKYLVKKLNDIAERAQGFTEVRGDYPEWAFKKESVLRQLVTETYRELYDAEPVTDIIHAGLECGYISKKRPDIDIIAMGPEILDIHTTEERMSIESVERVYDLILKVLEKIR